MQYHVCSKMIVGGLHVRALILHQLIHLLRVDGNYQKKTVSGGDTLTQVVADIVHCKVKTTKQWYTKCC